MKAAEFQAKGHGKEAAWVDLVNSEEWDTWGRRTDHLEDPSWPAFFLAQWRFPEPGRAGFPADRFRALRGVLRRAAQAAYHGRALGERELRALNEALSVAGSRRLCHGQNGWRLEFAPETEGWEWILAETARSFADLLTRDGASRIKVCRNPGCRWVFYDATKARTRRWCSDKVCGNRERVRRARARARG